MGTIIALFIAFATLTSPIENSYTDNPGTEESTTTTQSSIITDDFGGI